MRRLHGFGMVLVCLQMLVMLAVASKAEVNGAVKTATEVWTTIYIRADGSVDPPAAPISSPDNITYTFTDDIHYTAYGQALVIERDSIELDGNGHQIIAGSLETQGVVLSGRNNVTVRRLFFLSFACGIVLSSCHGCHISDNYITPIYNRNGIYLSHSDNSIISRNHVASCLYGITLEFSSDNYISENNIPSAHLGIQLTESNNNTIIKNNVEAYIDRTFTGCVYMTNSNANHITENNLLADSDTAYNNTHYLYFGSSSGNYVFHNNFAWVNNPPDGTVPGHIHCVNSANTWDDGYPSGGNYWCDYLDKYPNASEIDDSGIWDTPYVIDADNTDHYPLVNEVIVPEYPLFSVLPMFMMATFLAVAAYHRLARQSQMKRDDATKDAMPVVLCAS